MARETTYDVPRAELLSAAELRSLRTMHDGMAQTLGASLSNLLRDTVDVSLAEVEQAGYGEFIRSLDDHSCFSLVKADPLGDCLLLDIGLPILYPMLDRMMGGGQEDAVPPSRPPSDIELSLASRITRLFLDELCRAWQGVMPLTAEVVQVVGQPRQLRALPSDEAVAVVGFRLALGKHRGLVQLCLPCRAILRFGARLTDSRNPNQTSPSASDDASADSNGVNISVEMNVALAATPITAAELRGLRVGDIIVTDTDAERPAEVSLDGEPKFSAKPGSLEGRKAIRLVEPL